MDKTQERLVILCKLWGIVKFFHPFLAYRPVDWDRALVDAIPAVKAAANAEAFADAIGRMLAVLGDPATRVIHSKADKDLRDRSSALSPALLLENDILVFDFTDYKACEDFSAVLGTLNQAEEKFSDAKAVVFDLRMRVSSKQTFALSYVLDSALPQLFRLEDLIAPRERTRQHLGFASQYGAGSHYHSAFLVSDGVRFPKYESARRVSAVFIVDRRSVLPRAALALQDAGHGAIVAEEGFYDGLLVTLHSVALEGDFKADIRLGEVLRADGTIGVAPDVIVPVASASGPDVALEAAIGLATNFTPRRAEVERSPAIAAPAFDADYADMPYPAVEYRLLALFRIYNVFAYFFPYRDLMDSDWDEALAAFIPRVEAATDAVAYKLAVAEVLTYTQDSHVGIGRALRDYYGDAVPPIRLRWIEGAAVIAAFTDADAARSAGATIGDIVLSVDDEPVKARMVRIGRYEPASTPQSHREEILRHLLRGPADKPARLLVRGGDGRDKELHIERKAEIAVSWRDGEMLRWLPGNIGYADLERLQLADVDAMFEKFAAAKAIIFDMRGYPNGTGWAIAPRLSERPQPVAARFERPRVFAPLSPQDDLLWQVGRDVFLQSIPPASGPRYSGRTVMLIDEGAISQAEHTGLFFKAANGTAFVGSPTAGANGDVTGFPLPGGIDVSFTGQAVMHPDGKRLQRVGLIPDVEAYQTIAGLREGRDDVLLAAIAFIERSL